jgi:MraZ protein
MLRGSSIAKVDEKGRLKLPAQFRAAIEPVYGVDFFVTSLRGESVRIYPMEAWYRVEEKLSRVSSLGPAVMRFKKFVNYYGQCAAMDGQGRLLIHPLLREKAGIRGEVVVLGQQDYLEVWNRSAFEEQLAGEPLTDSDLETLADLGI